MACLSRVRLSQETQPSENNIPGSLDGMHPELIPVIFTSGSIIFSCESVQSPTHTSPRGSVSLLRMIPVLSTRMPILYQCP